MKTYQNLTAGLLFRDAVFSTYRRRAFSPIILLFVFLFVAFTAGAQLGVYEFTGAKNCPNQNPAVTTQPANAVFSNFTSAKIKCKEKDNVFNAEDWNDKSTIDLSQYVQFTITAQTNFILNLTNLSFRNFVEDEDNTTWVLRSNIDNYGANVATGAVTESSQIASIALPAALFNNLASVTFRLYLVHAKDNGTEWTIDNVTLDGAVVAAPATPPNPTSDSPQCTNPGVTITASGTPPAGETWYWQTAPNGTSTANSSTTLNVTTSGTYYIRSQDNATLVWSGGVGSVSVIVNGDVTVPVFALGATSTRCQSAQTIVYNATASNASSLTYSLDAASLAAGNTINPSTGAVTFLAGWSGESIITATAVGCNGPQTATHTVTTNGLIGVPVFAFGTSSFRCAGASTINYAATAANSTSITYSLDGLSSLTGSSINPVTGTVTFSALTLGTTTITARATGCNGTRTATHTVTVNAAVGTPVFTMGASSVRCRPAGAVTYAATASNNSGLTYSLDAASIASGNTINSATGTVIYSPDWIGTTTITVSAEGCNGPKTAVHTVTITDPVSTPVFVSGPNSTRCQGAGTETYSANEATGATITYSLNAASLALGNTINSSTGEVIYSAGFSGTSIVTASVSGCNGLRTSTHTVTVTATVGFPFFTLGPSSTRCQGAGSVVYSATATNSTSITYSLDAASLAAGNTIDPATGEVTYDAAWNGVSTITATADGCNGPRSRTHTATTSGSVGTPAFTMGASSTRCQRAGVVSYWATAANSTSITYSLDAASLAAGNTINSLIGNVTYVAGWVGTSVITATAAGCNGPQISTHTVITEPSVTTPVFAMGASSSRCQGAETITYSASSNNTTGIVYTLNAAAIAGGNTIDASTGEVTYAAGWSGMAVISASASGCNGPLTSTHTVTTTATVGTPVFNLGATSNRCQGAGTVAYSATASNHTDLTYSLDLTSIAGGNSINATTGAVTYAAGWSGVSTITVVANGCNGPTTATHTATITPTVGLPVFTLGSSSTRCPGGTEIYSATSTDATGITYSLNVGSLAGGNTINSATGQVTYAPGFNGTSIVTANAAGCGGPRMSTHTVTVTPNVGSPVFVLGLTSTRCQGAGTVTYTANATNSTGIVYSLDAASIAAGNTINSSTGTVTYAAGFSGTSQITASANGCNGPRNLTHTVTVTPTVGIPAFTAGATSTRCQGVASVLYTATATNSTGITYSLDAASTAGGNIINTNTGNIFYSAGWSGTSIITASATGCNGPVTGTHTVTVTPTVGAPVFVLGTNSTRCEGAGSVTYTASSTNTTGITYTLDAASIAGGNSINSSTGTVTYAAGWTGTSTITANATGCNGPRTSTHTVTITPTVGTPVFVLGSVSTRMQGAGTATYTALATNNSGITYSLNAASLAGGNTINASTGAVTYNAAWSSPTIITATAAGCGGPKTATHTVTVNSAVVTKQLYLSDPSQSLDRVDPVNTGDATTASTGLLSSTGTTFTTFTMAPAVCSDLVLKAGTISVTNHITISSGTMPVNPAITAVLRYGANNIITLSNPIYNNGVLTWTGTLASDMIIPAGQAITLQVTTAQAGVIFRIDFDSQTKPSKINLPVSTYINVASLDVYSAAYPGGLPVVSGVGGTTKYIRATVTDPFGFSDITGMNITISPGSTVAATSVSTNGCTRVYEYAWTTPAVSRNYAIAAIAREGFENTVTHTANTNYGVCATCAPVAIDDSASGAGGTPTSIDVLANDYDPNNNINSTSLAIVVQPANGTAYVANNTIVYLPNGAFQGKDTITYQICDLTSPTPLCATAQVFLTIDPLVIDICGDATKTHTYYIPYPEDQSYDALQASGSPSMPSNNIRTIISVKVPYPGMRIVWDEWEDGYEANALNPTQSTTKVWGDGNPFNGIAPGYGSDIIPAGGSIVLDNTMNANPRNPANIYFDGKDKVSANGQLALTQVSAEPSIMSVQSIKTNITSTYDFGQSFTIPLGEDFPSRDFRYTALFIRAAENNTTVRIDKDNNGTFETTTVLNEGGSYLVDGGVRTGAIVTSDKPVGVELNAGGEDNYSIRNAPIFPATWYSNTYYTPVPTSDNAADNPKDTSVVMFYNSLNRPISINWYSGVPASGVIAVPAKSAVRFPLAYSTTAAYKFVNLAGESFTAIEIVGSYAPGGGGAGGSAYDWSFNLISEDRLTDYTTVAWAPGGLDLAGGPDPDVNGNPIWVTPTANTTVYVKYNGDVSGSSGLVSPCGLRYDVAYNVNALNYIKIRDNTDNDQGGIAIYTCNGAKIAAVYGEDPRGSTAGASAYWDVGSTIQPFCKQKLVIATDDYATSLVSQPVTITVLNNDFGFLAEIDPATVSTLGLLQPSHGTVTVNENGTILYTPALGFSGVDTFEYRVCSTPSPIVCDIALVVVTISTCPSNGNQNIISGQVFIDRNKDAFNNDGGAGLPGVKVYLYTDGNCSGSINANELTDSVTVDSSGFYQFVKYPEKIVADDFDATSGGRTCNNGSDGDTPWSSNWTDAGDGSTGFCQSSSTADVEILQDGAFGYGLRVKDDDVYARRSVNLNGSIKAFLSFSYRRTSSAFASGQRVYIQVSSNGSTFTTIYTISGDGSTDASPVMIYNQDISAYASSTTAIRIITNGITDNDADVFIDNISIRYLKYPQCYITSIHNPSIPASYSLTTVGQKTVTITSGGTCTSQFDFGFGKPNVTVSGSLRNDKDGLTNGLVDGPVIGTPSGSSVYAYLCDVTGNVAFKTTVNASTGAYSFPLAEINTDYTLVLSTDNLPLGAPAPANLNCNAMWIAVGDSYGTNNAAGTGNETGSPNAAIAVRTATSNVTNVNFGIQRLPNSDNFLRSINEPRVDDMITLNGQAVNPPVLAGSDPEDCVSGCVLTNRTVIIDTVPSNSEMYYNNVLLTNGHVINNFDPNKLQIKVTAAALGDVSITFWYSYVDAAVMKDPSPARYTVVWLVPLPSTGLTVAASADGNNAVVKWSTLSEQNTRYFIVERSVDNNNFIATGQQVQAAGNSDTKRDYSVNDNIESLMNHPIVYYRIRLVDIDGKVTYSNITAIRLSKKPGVSIWPNPFQSSITISITTMKETTLEIRMFDSGGKTLRNFSQQVGKGISQVSLSDLQNLPIGVYLVEITDKAAGTTFQKLIKNK